MKIKDRVSECSSIRGLFVRMEQDIAYSMSFACLYSTRYSMLVPALIFYDLYQKTHIAFAFSCRNDMMLTDYSEECKAIRRATLMKGDFTVKLLIAEDELRAREGLRLLAAPMFTRTETASNGQDALALAFEMEPDVVLCDVRMPKMNGIELAQALRLRFPDIHILFISAYSDKEYLKSAISIQADGYLEKPIDEDELLEYLRRIQSEVEAQDKERERSDLADLFARQQILHAVLHKDDIQGQAMKLNPALTEAVLHSGQFLPVSIRMQWPGNMSAVQYGFFPELRLAELLNRISPQNLFATLSESQIGVLFYGDTIPNAAECRKQLIPVLEAIRAANPQVLNVCACTGRPCMQHEKLYSHYHAAHLQVRWMCFAGKGPCTVETLNPEAGVIRDASEQFGNLLKTHQLDAAKELIRNQTEEIIRGNACSIEQTRQYYEQLLAICLRVQGTDPTGYRNVRMNTEILSTFGKLSTLPEMCRYLCMRIDEIAPALNLNADSRGLIREIQTYIRQNLSDAALSVQDIADHVGLSENYLSALFKRETGIPLRRVIIDLRIEQAKYLLVNRYRVAEVARRCGFSSPGYFHSVFKKYTGMSPAAYVEESLSGQAPENKGRDE